MRVHDRIADPRRIARHEIDPTGATGSRIAALACFVPLPLAIAIAIVLLGDVSIASARGRLASSDAAATQAVHVDADDAPRGAASSWRPILAGCLGVLFGAAIAVWHIKGSKRP